MRTDQTPCLRVASGPLLTLPFCGESGPRRDRPRSEMLPTDTYSVCIEPSLLLWEGEVVLCVNVTGNQTLDVTAYSMLRSSRILSFSRTAMCHVTHHTHMILATTVYVRTSSCGALQAVTATPKWVIPRIFLEIVSLSF